VIVTLRQFAAASRALGRKPKQMLADLRRVIADIAPELTDRRNGKLRPRAAAIGETIQWCIAQYYRLD
jgi:hypothetical protein